VEGTGLVSAARRRAAAVAVALALPLLAGCGEARDVAQGVDRARDCAAVVGELAGVDWNDVRRSAAAADQAARRLDDRLREVDDADVKRAGEALAARIQRLADAARGTDRAAVQRAVDEVESAARQLAATCDVPVDQVGG
jgi:outer membrane murein-binding lipoprotein Lpp